jgi:nucleoside-diphosphate-sugar epimerase
LPTRSSVVWQDQEDELAKIFVTGATGRAGRFVVSALTAAGHEIRALCRSVPRDEMNIEWRQADLVQTEDFRQLLTGCDGVIHLAAALDQPHLMDAVNVEATRRLAAQSAEQGIRYFGHASSIVVYGSPRSRLVDETTPRISPVVPISRQYHAEPYMREYARTKAAAELAIEALHLPMAVDFYRPAVVVDEPDLLRAGDWGIARRTFASYRRTQFITAVDTAAAIVHLMERGLGKQARAQTEAYNLVDKNVLTYRALLAEIYRATGDPRFRLILDVPVVADLLKDFLRYRNPGLRYPLGMLEISGEKLLNTGFVFPVGIDRAIARATKRLAIRRESRPFTLSR